MNYTLDKFCSEYTYFNHNNVPFGGDYFIWRSKVIQDGNSHLWHQRYSLPFTKVVGFVGYTFSSNIIGVVDDEYSWGDFKMIKYGKIPAIINYVSHKRSLFIYAFIKPDKI